MKYHNYMYKYYKYNVHVHVHVLTSIMDKHVL